MIVPEEPMKMSTHGPPKIYFPVKAKQLKKLFDSARGRVNIGKLKEQWMPLKHDVGLKFHKDFSGLLFERWNSVVATL